MADALNWRPAGLGAVFRVEAATEGVASLLRACTFKINSVEPNGGGAEKALGLRVFVGLDPDHGNVLGQAFEPERLVEVVERVLVGGAPVKVVEFGLHASSAGTSGRHVRIGA